MEPRIKNPAALLPDAMQALMQLNAVTQTGGVPAATPGTVSTPTPVEPDRAKYANPYVQPPVQQQPQQPPQL